VVDLIGWPPITCRLPLELAPGDAALVGALNEPEFDCLGDCAVDATAPNPIRTKVLVGDREPPVMPAGMRHVFKRDPVDDFTSRRGECPEGCAFQHLLRHPKPCFALRRRIELAREAFGRGSV
jgi:hypothetical protein